MIISFKMRNFAITLDPSNSNSIDKKIHVLVLRTAFRLSHIYIAHGTRRRKNHRDNIGINDFLKIINKLENIGVPSDVCQVLLALQIGVNQEFAKNYYS